MSEATPSFTEADFPPLVENATTREQPPETSDQADSDGEDENLTATRPDKGKERETTPAQSEAAEPPDSVIGENDGLSQDGDDDENDPHLLADLRAAIQESREEARKAQSSQDPVTFTNPDVGPSKRARTSSIPDINRAYQDPKTPQKRKNAAHTDSQAADSSFDTSQTPTLQWARAIVPSSLTNSTANSPQPQRDLRARVEDDVDDDDDLAFYADEDVDMEDADTIGDQSTRADSPLPNPSTFRFDDDETPTSFNARGVRGADRNPNQNLPPRNYAAMPSAYLRALGHVSRNEDGSMPSYVAAIEHWQKNISPDMLQMVNEEGGWLAFHIFDGGTLQRLANEANDEEVVRAIREYILGFPGVTNADVRIMVAQPRCHYLAASNKHAPPRVIFVWIRSKRVRATLIHQQTHDLSDMCTFHVTPTDFDSPSYYVMNLTAALKDIPREIMRRIARFAIAGTLVDDDKFRALIREATATDPRPTDVKVCEAVMGIDVRFYKDPGIVDNTSELSVFFAPVTDDYQKSQEIKEHIRICHPRFKYKAHVFHLSWDHHKGNTGSLFCPLCLLDDHPTPRCPFPYIRDWQGPGIDHTLTNALNDRGTNVNALWDEAYILAIPQGLPVHPENGYESDEKIALNTRHPWYYTPSATVQNRIANRYSASNAVPAPRGGSNRNPNRSRTPKTRAQSNPNPPVGRGSGRGRGRGGYGRGGRGRGRGLGRGA